MADPAEQFPGVDPVLHGALNRFILLEERSVLQAEAGPTTRGLLDKIVARDRELLNEVLGEKAVTAILDEYLNGHARDIDVLTKLELSDELPEPELTEARATLESAEQQPLHRLALFYAAGKKAVEGVRASSEAGPTAEKSTPAGLKKAAEFLDRDLKTVAEELVGMKIAIGDRHIIVTATRDQDKKFNEKFAKRPIFGEDRCDIYFVRVYTSYQMYVRAGEPNALQCVAVRQATADDGTELINPAKITSHLGIKRNALGTVSLKDKTMTVTLRPTG